MRRGGDDSRADGPGGAALGLDIGSINLHAVILERGAVADCVSLPVKGSPWDALKGALSRLALRRRGRALPVAAIGRGREILASTPGILLENEITASAAAARLLTPGARCVMEVGGHFSKWVLLDEAGEVQDYSLNELCAAGSGAFLEQQASRLKMSVAQLAASAAGAPSGASVAGRCSVFAKSDMIHLQQKGTPTDEIAYGLCLAMARNFAATVLKGRDLVRPAAFVGGCAANKGLVRAFREVLSLEAADLLIPERHAAFGAVGAALAAARRSPPVVIEGLAAEVSRSRGRRAQTRAVLPPLPVPEPAPSGEEAAPGALGEGVGARRGAPGGKVFLGVDVGSVSTDLVLLDEECEVVQGVYLPTRGKPIAVMQEGLAMLRERSAGRAAVAAVGATGSGRHLARRFLGADEVRNEITAQLRSTVRYFPDVDTVFEIGGQDSKYISAKNGAISDFAMNKICAAGTGSFLEEAAEQLGISIVREFEEKALRSRSPADLGSRCTVFMDTELVHALQRGVSVEDAAAGLATSIGRNYLEKVVAHRPVGKAVVFQGGVASNRAVVAALGELLGRRVRVHPYNRLSGAIGAALIAREWFLEGGGKTEFVGFDAGPGYAMSSFECRQCPNMCQVNKLDRGGESAYFGDACERYSSGATRKKRDAVSPPDLTAGRERLVLERIDSIKTADQAPEAQSPIERLLGKYAPQAPWAAGGPARAKARTRPPEHGPGKAGLSIGIARASLYFELLPLWAAMFKSLGFDIVLSSPSSKELLAKGTRKLCTEACLPVKLAYSHAVDLAEGKADRIFMPSILDLPSPFGSPELCSTCPYTQSLPYMVRSAVEARFLIPQINMSVEKDGLAEGMEALAGELGVTAPRLRAAYQTGKETHLAFKEGLQRIGAEVLGALSGWAAVLIGKPYNIYDSFLNLNLVRHLARMGVTAIPYEFLPWAGQPRLDESWDSLPWRFNRDYVKAALTAAADPRLYPVVVSNFGCGPDGFTLKHMEKILGAKPALFLEFDEHRGEAGMVTRLEAFLDEVAGHRKKGPAPRPEPVGIRKRAKPRARRFFIPYFADEARVYAGVLRYAGFKTEVLPPPDAEVRRKGERFSSGKECHPYILLAGDLVRLAESRAKGDPPAVFMFPGTAIPCLLTQYGPGHRLILDQLGETGIEVMTPDHKGLYELLGLQGGVRMWRGFVAMDMLIKASCALRPYELVQGSVDKVHEANCRRIEDAVAGGDILAATRVCVGRLSAVAIDRESWERRDKPVVGLAGDSYTRVNRFANQELVAKLSEMGCEVAPSSFIIDIFDFGLNSAVRTSLHRREVQDFFQKGSLLLLKEMSEAGIKNLFRERFRPADEPSYREVVEIAAPYVGERANEILMVNTAKMVDFARKGADGIINAVCFNCMVGSVSAAIISRLRKDHGNIPVVNLVFGEAEGASQALRLEAFVHQVKAYRGRSVPTAPGKKMVSFDKR
ncbi:MAG: hypothetical protein HY748_02505 [Elusimicrobia bacterium]|nr:hypothetical protein [Elusimicrobiota bacterium]